MSLRFWKLRKENITKAKLAEAVQVDVRTITNWEKENGVIPSLDICQELAQILKVRTYDIYQCFMDHPDDLEWVSEQEEKKAEAFLPFLAHDYKIKDRGYHGFVQYRDQVFCFGGIYRIPQDSDEKSMKGFMVMDSNYNLVLFSTKKVKKIIPVSHANGNYTCLIRTTQPVFACMDKEIVQKGYADVQLTLFSC